MTMQRLQELVERHAVSAGAVAALCAALDSKASGAPLDPALEARIRDLLAALGAGDVLDDLGAQEAAPVLSMLRAMYLLDEKLLFAATRKHGWSHAEPELLQAVGHAARMHAHALTRGVVPACEGLSARLSTPGARLLDAGVGVAGTAIAVAQMWPELRIVGIDPWQPALRLARENVDRAGLSDRFELREQGVEALDDRDAFDLVWFALQFIPERFVWPGLERSLASLRPGGWIVSGATPEGGMAPAQAALLRLRFTQWGGPVWSTSELEGALRKTGFVDVCTLPTEPGAPVAFVVGRRATG